MSSEVDGNVGFLELVVQVAMAALPGPIYAAPIVIDVDAADDEPEMELLPRYPRWWTTKHAAQAEHRDFVYAIYEKAVDWPSSSHDKWEPATHLVMTHRLRTLEWYAEFLQIDVRRLTKLGSEHLLLQFMRKPDAGSPEDRV
ncbi:birA [Symbiodinium sp. KB8]|nr:birA [Symbiodinium sp. KB8]